MFYKGDKQFVFSPPSISASAVECYTPAQQIPQEYRVRMEIDEAIRDTSRHFTYREDPVVLNIHPAKSFLRWVKFCYRNKKSNKWMKNHYAAQQSIKRNCIFISIFRANCFYYGTVAEGKSFPFRGGGEGGRVPLFSVISLLAAAEPTCDVLLGYPLHSKCVSCTVSGHYTDCWGKSFNVTSQQTRESKWVLKKSKYNAT